MSDEDEREAIPEVLKNVYYEKKPAAFAGGSLVVKYEDNKTAFISLENCKSGEEKFWYCMLYLKHKTSSHYYFNDSIDCIVGNTVNVDKYGLETDVAKFLLLNGVSV